VLKKKEVEKRDLRDGLPFFYERGSCLIRSWKSGSCRPWSEDSGKTASQGKLFSCEMPDVRCQKLGIRKRPLQD